jgi:hypothetical protein
MRDESMDSAFVACRSDRRPQMWSARCKVGSLALQMPSRLAKRNARDNVQSAIDQQIEVHNRDRRQRILSDFCLSGSYPTHRVAVTKRQPLSFMPILTISSTGLIRHHRLSTQHEENCSQMTEKVLILLSHAYQQRHFWGPGTSDASLSGFGASSLRTRLRLPQPPLLLCAYRFFAAVLCRRQDAKLTSFCPSSATAAGLSDDL